MTVGDMFDNKQINLDFIDENCLNNEYWLTCYDFIHDNWDTYTDDLSSKQYDWMKCILDDCIEIRIKQQ